MNIIKTSLMKVSYDFLLSFGEKFSETITESN